MVRLLIDDRIPEKLAKAAVQSLELPLDKDECFLKVLEFSGSEYEADDEINALVREFEKEAGEYSEDSGIGRNKVHVDRVCCTSTGRCRQGANQIHGCFMVVYCFFS